jgi:DNA-binding transcriptional regulator YiaG
MSFCTSIRYGFIWELFRDRNRIPFMGKSSRVSLVHRQALNQAMLYANTAQTKARHEPRVYLRALRSRLRMSQAQLARRSGIEQRHISRFETGKSDLRLNTLRRLFDAMFCDLLIVPRPRKRPGDALADHQLGRSSYLPIWD